MHRSSMSFLPRADNDDDIKPDFLLSFVGLDDDDIGNVLIGSCSLKLADTIDRFNFGIDNDIVQAITNESMPIVLLTSLYRL